MTEIPTKKRVRVKYVVKDGVPIIKPKRGPGGGRVQKLLRKMKIGQCVWGLTFDRAYAMRKCGHLLGIKVAIRSIPGLIKDGKRQYAVWKTHEDISA